MNAGGWAAIIIALTGLVTAVTGLVALFRRQGQLGTQVGQVHALVNNQLDRQLTYNQQLAAALTAAGVTVPQQDSAS